MFKKLFILGGAIQLLCQTPVYAQPARKLTLAETVRIALAQNLLIQQQRLTPQIRQEQIVQKQAEFDPAFSIGATNTDSANLSPSALGGARVLEQEQFITSAGLSKGFTTGTTASLNFITRRVKSNSTFITINPYYESGLSLNLMQPLLRDFGIEVNEAQINIAVNDRKISLDDFRRQIIQTLSDCQKAYWDMVFAQENLKVKKLLLQQAQDLLEQNRAKVSAGVLPPVDVLEAQAGVATREEEIIIARDSLQDAEDKLKNILNWGPEFGVPEITLEAADTPYTVSEKPDLEAGIKSALAQRPEYSQLKWQLESSRINEMVSRNQLLPALNLQGGYRLNGLDDNYSDSVSMLWDAETTSWYAGISLSLPLGNRQAKSAHIISRLEQEQLQFKLRQQEQDIILEVKGAVRQVYTNLQRIETTKAAQRLEEEKLRMQTERHELGMVTTHDLLEYQVNLAQARVRQLQAVTDYNNSLVSLETARGTTLDKLNIRLDSILKP